MIAAEAATSEDGNFTGSIFDIGKMELGKANDILQDESMFDFGKDETTPATEKRGSFFDTEVANVRRGEEVDRWHAEGRDPWSPSATGKGTKSRTSAAISAAPTSSTSLSPEFIKYIPGPPPNLRTLSSRRIS